jgi:hypothetical protein
VSILVEGRSDENVSRDSEPVSQLRDHGDGERPAAVEDLGDAGAAADSVDRVGRVNGMVSRFVRVDEGY